MVFIRPKILRDDSSIHQLSSRKDNYIRGKQLDMRAKGVSLMSDEDTPLLPEWDDSLALPPSFEDSMKKSEDERFPLIHSDKNQAEKDKAATKDESSSDKENTDNGN